jgi:N-acetylglucosamine malate deacetylase 2
MITRSRGRDGPPVGKEVMSRPGRLLPGWRVVLAVVAHPDDETFGLGAVVDSFTTGGAAVHVLCFTQGEASTLNGTHAALRHARQRELSQAAAELGVATVTLLDYPDGRLADVTAGKLASQVTRLAGRLGAEGLLVFDDGGITGHPDHQAATRAAVRAGSAAALPVLAWALQDGVAGRLRRETGGAFTGQPPGRIDLCIRVDRARQRRAALMHATQISPAAVLWRRLQLQGDCEHLRWLHQPGGAAPVRAGTAPEGRARREVTAGSPGLP